MRTGTRAFDLALALALVSAAALAATPAGCRRAPLRSCGDRLGGVWREVGDEPSTAPRHWHIVDDGRSVHLFPLWDTTRLPDGSKTPVGGRGPVLSPLRVELERQGGTLAGRASARIVLPGASCERAFPVSIRACAGAELELDGLAPLPVSCDGAPVSGGKVHLVRE
jgi:hypothetical protein